MTLLTLAPGETSIPRIATIIRQAIQYLNGGVPVAGGGTGYAGGAWTAYTATLTPNTGSITQGGSASDLQIGKMVHYSIAATVTNVTGSPASFTVAFPVAPKRDTFILGGEEVNSGTAIRTVLSAGATTSLAIRNLTTGALWVPALNDEYCFTGVYEAQ